MSEYNIVKTPCSHCSGKGYTETKTKTVTETREEPVHIGYTFNGPNIEGTAAELERKGYKPSQFGWHNGPEGNTD